MKKLFLLFTIFSVFLITSCGKKEFDYKYIRTTEQKGFIVEGIVRNKPKDEYVVKNLLGIIKYMKDNRSNNETAAKEYLEYLDLFDKKGINFYKVGKLADNCNANTQTWQDIMDGKIE